MNRRQLYQGGVEWVAWNDLPGDPGACGLEEVSVVASVRLLADMFDTSPGDVARDVIALRDERLRLAVHRRCGL